MPDIFFSLTQQMYVHFHNCNHGRIPDYNHQHNSALAYHRIQRNHFGNQRGRGNRICPVTIIDSMIVPVIRSAMSIIDDIKLIATKQL